MSKDHQVQVALHPRKLVMNISIYRAKMTVFKTFATTFLSLPEEVSVNFVHSGNKLSGTGGALFAKH